MAPKNADAKRSVPPNGRARAVGAVTPLSDLETRVKLLCDHGVRFYKDGLLELQFGGSPPPARTGAEEGYKV